MKKKAGKISILLFVSAIPITFFNLILSDPAPYYTMCTYGCFSVEPCSSDSQNWGNLTSLSNICGLEFLLSVEILGILLNLKFLRLTDVEINELITEIKLKYDTKNNENDEDDDDDNDEENNKNNGDDAKNTRKESNDTQGKTKKQDKTMIIEQELNSKPMELSPWRFESNINTHRNSVNINNNELDTLENEKKFQTFFSGVNNAAKPFEYKE